MAGSSCKSELSRKYLIDISLFLTLLRTQTSNFNIDIFRVYFYTYKHEYKKYANH